MSWWTNSYFREEAYWPEYNKEFRERTDVLFGEDTKVEKSILDAVRALTSHVLFQIYYDMNEWGMADEMFKLKALILFFLFSIETRKYLIWKLFLVVHGITPLFKWHASFSWISHVVSIKGISGKHMNKTGAWTSYFLSPPFLYAISKGYSTKESVWGNLWI